MLARVKYLVITELTIATLFARIIVMRHQMSCYRFLCFSSGLTCGLLKKPYICRTPSSSNCPSAVPVKFHNYNDSVTRVAGKLWRQPMRLHIGLKNKQKQSANQWWGEGQVFSGRRRQETLLVDKPNRNTLARQPSDKHGRVNGWKREDTTRYRVG
jgi:hypothetical protein